MYMAVYSKKQKDMHLKQVTILQTSMNSQSLEENVNFSVELTNFMLLSRANFIPNSENRNDSKFHQWLYLFDLP